MYQHSFVFPCVQDKSITCGQIWLKFDILWHRDKMINFVTQSRFWIQKAVYLDQILDRW